MPASLHALFRSRRGWSNAERAQFARIERLLAETGLAVDVEHGETDEGEPWCVFCARQTGDVIIHAACIDGRFLIDSPMLPRQIEGRSFERCAEQFFEDCRLPAALSDRRNRVMLHPSAMLASLFLTILLYAQASSETDLFGPGAEGAAAGEQGSLARALTLRLKALAGQFADYATGPETGQGQAGQGGASLASIPAGMALAVIAIAEDLARAQAAAPERGDGDMSGGAGAGLARPAIQPPEPVEGRDLRDAEVKPEAQQHPEAAQAEAGDGQPPEPAEAAKALAAALAVHLPEMVSLKAGAGAVGEALAAVLPAPVDLGLAGLGGATPNEPHKGGRARDPAEADAVPDAPAPIITVSLAGGDPAHLADSGQDFADAVVAMLSSVFSEIAAAAESAGRVISEEVARIAAALEDARAPAAQSASRTGAIAESAAPIEVVHEDDGAREVPNGSKWAAAQQEEGGGSGTISAVEIELQLSDGWSGKLEVANIASTLDFVGSKSALSSEYEIGDDLFFYFGRLSGESGSTRDVASEDIVSIEIAAGETSLTIVMDQAEVREFLDGWDDAFLGA